jgi:hypothetical protein
MGGVSQGDHSCKKLDRAREILRALREDLKITQGRKETTMDIMPRPLLEDTAVVAKTLKKWLAEHPGSRLDGDAYSTMINDVRGQHPRATKVFVHNTWCAVSQGRI